MKAKDFDKIKTITDIFLERFNYTIPSGTEGYVVECYSEPYEAYAADLPVPEGVWTATTINTIITPDQFIVVEE